MKKPNVLKAAIIVLFATVLSSMAFAETYKCDVARDAQGNAYIGDTIYSVNTDANGGVTLVSTYYYSDAKGHLPHSNYFYMAPFERSPVETSYRAGDIVVTFQNVSGPTDQIASTKVTLTLTASNDTYSAVCK